jgi:fibronectin-binding autotransporter adhesin
MNTAPRNNTTIGSLAGAGSVTNNSSSRAATLTTGGDNTSTTYSGVMANGSSKALGLTKTGTGRLSLSGVNTYTGATSITGGTLALTGSGSINSTSGITLNGGTLMQDSSTPLNRTITFTSGAIGGTGAYTGNMSPGSVHIAPGDGGAGTFAISGNLTMASASVLDFDLSTVGGSNDLLTMTGALTLDGTLNVSAPGGGLGSGQYTLISGFGSLTDNTLNLGSMPPGHNYTITTDATHVYLNASPEPATLCLLALGGLALLKKRIARSRKG